ncbi:phosphate acyltransferase PlsX [Helicobacter kayseriensis]|uniref:phosphate acyltransferase PlsX n=1 Tax=Helicobacter kayseriensis TaxID=2905877 RepID=UPI001E437C0C|nr:phosphate acyltransferase PlsX [Helicobacter kayseriensis]MCE3047693.1 phosphate acyltransferase PlsX [Helicobacter kayseriensis]MCE3049069.1 phosphate acyltransferase PlsX [Helicobacter kayseriensis]
MKIVIDAMGGDYGVNPIIQGTLQALQKQDFFALVVGDQDQITPLIPSKFKSRIQIIHSKDYIRMEEQASSAIKRQDSSIFMGIEILRQDNADAIVSAGHSGATMSLATLRLGRISGVSRPAICTTMPTSKNTYSLILDAGANTDCKPEYLLDFALMGYEYCKNVMNVAHPKIGLLSNGEEETKGNDLTKETFALLKKYPFFIGNVEGKNIFDGSVDVVVCDGFSGNLVLKASEGVAQTITKILKQEIQKTLWTKIGALLMRKSFQTLKSRIDHSEYGGAPLLGVNKPVIISHGSSNARAIECAIYQAIHAINGDICTKIQQALKKD